jgi:hypothetical protein
MKTSRHRHGGALIDDSVGELFRLIREHLAMDVVFVQQEPSHPLAFPDSPPPPGGGYAAVPIQLRDGRVFGALRYSFESNRSPVERDLKRLEMSAKLTARLIDAAEGIGAPPLAMTR